MNSHYNSANKLTYILLAVYMAVLFWILLLKMGVQFSYMEERRVNLVPFNAFFRSGENVDATEMILNILVFVPLGVYTGVLFNRWRFIHKFLFFLSLSFMIELLQFIFKIGAFDVSDIITNTFGGIAGLLITVMVVKLSGNKVKAQKFINIIAATGSLLLILFLVLLKLQMLPIRYQ